MAFTYQFLIFRIDKVLFLYQKILTMEMTILKELLGRMFQVRKTFKKMITFLCKKSKFSKISKANILV